MRKLSQMFAKAVLTLMVIGILIPNVQALSLFEGDFSMTEIDPKITTRDLTIEKAGINDANTHFYAKVCATTATGLSNIDIKFTIDNESYTYEDVIAPTYDGGCSTAQINIDEHFPNLTFGTYTLSVTVDPNDEVSELNEFNNREETEVTIPLEIAGTAPLDEDLTPEFITENAEDLYITAVGIEDGDTKFYADVCSEGLELDNVVLDFVVNGIHSTLELESVPTDDCSRYYSWGTSYFQVEPGDTVTITATIDYYDNVDETDETNNQMSSKVTIQEYDTDNTETTTPDIYLSDIGFENDQFYTKVCGIDTEDITGETVEIDFAIGSQVHTETVTIPEAGTCDNLLYIPVADNFLLMYDQEYTLIVTLDPDDNFEETSEKNNVMNYTFSVPSPDKNIYISDAGAAENQEDLYMYVCGEGTVGIEYMEYAFEANGYTHVISDYAPSDGNCEYFYSDGVTKFDFETGTEYTVNVYADYYDDVEETNETDNAGSFTLTTAESTNKDLYISDAGVESDGTNFYATVCAENTTALESVDINFNANGYDNTLTLAQVPSDGNCKTYYSWGTHVFGLDTDDAGYTLTVTIDYNNEMAEADESNNVYTTTIGELETTEKDLYISDLGIEDDYTNFYMTVCGEGTSGTESVKINFGAGSYNNTLGITAPANGTCKTFYSWGMSNFGIETDTTYTLTGTVDYHEYLDETDETNNEENYTFEIPSTVEEGENQDDLMFRPWIMFVRIGDFNGSDSDTNNTYTGQIRVNETDLMNIEFLAPILLENNSDMPEEHQDTYTAYENGITYSNDILNHWDGYLFYVSPEEMDKSETHSVGITIDGITDLAIYNESDLGVYELGDGTDNKLIIENLAYLDDLGGEESTITRSDYILENIQSITDLLSVYAQTLEENSDEDTSDAFEKLTDFVLNPEILVSPNLTDEVGTYVAATLGDDEDFTQGDIENALDTTETYVASAGSKVKYYEGTIPFLDVEYQDWFYDFVSQMKEKDIVSGYGDTGQFGPANNLTVAEMLKIVLEMAGQGESEYTPTLVTGQNHWASGYVAKAEELGLSIVSDPNSDINRNTNRGEVLLTIMQALGIDVPEYSDSSFSDSANASWYMSVAEYAKDLGIVDGYSDGTFGYTNSINRAEVSKMIINTIEVFNL